MLKTGSGHIQSLKDGRQVFINGQGLSSTSSSIQPFVVETDPTRSGTLTRTPRRGPTMLI